MQMRVHIDCSLPSSYPSVTLVSNGYWIKKFVNEIISLFPIHDRISLSIIFIGFLSAFLFPFSLSAFYFILFFFTSLNNFTHDVRH